MGGGFTSVNFGGCGTGTWILVGFVSVGLGGLGYRYWGFGGWGGLDWGGEWVYYIDTREML